MDSNINEYRFNDDETDYKLRHEVITKAEYLKMIAEREIMNNK